MNKLLTITLNDLRIFFAERGNLIGLVVLPLAFTLVLGWAFGGGDDGGPSRVRMDIVDQDATPQSATLLAEIRAANSALVLCPMDNATVPGEDDFCRLGEDPLTLERAITRAQAERTEGLLVIPAGYGDALLDFEEVALDFYAAGNPTLPNVVEQTVLAVLQRVNTASLTAGVTGALIDEIGEQTRFGPFLNSLRDPFVRTIYDDAQNRIEQRPSPVRMVTSEGEQNETSIDQGFGQSVPGMGSMYVMFTVLGGISVLLRERKQWTLQRLTALPISRAQILGGKVLTYFTLGMIQYLIVFGVGFLVGMDFGDQPLALLLVMLAFTFCCTGIAFALAPNIQSQQQANGMTNLLALSLAPLGGAWWPLEIVPDFMRTVAYLSPVSWAMQGFHDIMWYNRTLVDVLPEVGVLAGAGAILFAIGVGRFRFS